MRIKISKVANDLNVGVNTVVEFLRRHDVDVENNPNARIDDSSLELLKNEFNNDKTLKKEADGQTDGRRKPKKDNPATSEMSGGTSTSGIPGLKVLGKIDLDAGSRRGNGRRGGDSRGRHDSDRQRGRSDDRQDRSRSDRQRDERNRGRNGGKDVKKEEIAASASNPGAGRQAAPAPVRNEKESVRTEATVENKTIQEKTEVKAPVVKEESQKDQKNTVQETPGSVFRLSTPPVQPELKVLGKIDLSSLNQSTRPKKRGKDDRRRGDKNRQGGGASSSQGADQQNADRKKRKRIGKEKIDIEKAASQPGFGSENRNKKKGGDKQGQNNQQGQQGGGGGDRKRGDRGQKGGNRRNERPQKPETNQEDVQKQVKETLARLTSKTPKKGLKWRKEKKEAIHNRELENQRREEAESKIIQLTEFVTANDLANLMEVPVNNVIATCMNLGVMVSINQRLDAETINIVAEEFGFTTEYVSADVTEAISPEEDKEEDLQPRPPIVTVMGHVDHGKTSLLDYIRKANVIAGEAGGITQHIGAYNVTLPDGRCITFLDTPGHEAFTAMRARGAKVTDLAIIIVAADDDVMPQTIEAINHASAAGVPMVFAINKIDKPAANPDKIKEELAGMNYLVEEWGGKYQSQDISAKKGIGVEELMEKVLL